PTASAAICRHTRCPPLPADSRGSGWPSGCRILLPLRNSSVCSYQLPAQLISGPQGHYDLIAEIQLVRHGPFGLLQHHTSGVVWQPIKFRAMDAGEALKPVQRPGLFEHLGIQFQRSRSGIAAGTAAGMLLEMTGRSE